MIKLFYVDRNATYKEWELLPNKLFIVEDIEAYLATKSAHTINDFQYIKNDLEIGVNIDFAQSYSQPKATTSFKYVAIQNTGENIHYYFVKKAVWRSKSCVRFELVMDVLNTFKEGYDYEFKANTKITREHKNRWNKKVKDMNVNFEWTSLISSSGTIVDGADITIYANSLSGDYIGEGEVFEYGSNNMEVDLGDYSTAEAIIDSLNELPDGTHIFIKDEFNNYIEFVLNFEVIYDYSYVRNIDYVNENINPLLVHNGANLIENNRTLLAQNWYLLYRNQNDPSDSLVNPVDCYLIPENEVNTDAAYISGGKLVPSWLEDGKYYYFEVPYNINVLLSNGVNLVTIPSPHSTAVVLRRIAVITKAGDKISVILVECSRTPDQSVQYCEAIAQYDDINYVTFSALPVNYQDENSFVPTMFSNYSSMSLNKEFNNSTAYSKLSPVSALDRTDAKNIKLIKLPYCPYNFQIVGNVLWIPLSVWEFVSIPQSNNPDIYALRLKNNSTKLSNTIYTNYSPLGELEKDFPYPPNIIQKRNTIASIELESKIYHSEFYKPTYVYDSFSFAFEMQKLKMAFYESYVGVQVEIKFDMTSTINSKFLFTFTNYVSDKAESNYYNVMPVARNNEEVLYNVPYINYVRTGYNYDIKNKNLQNVSNFVGLGLSAASIGASLLMPSVPLKIAGVIGSLVSMAMSVKSTITSVIQNENSIQQKQEQYKNQAASVVGSDDVDLMSVYAENRISYMLYKPTDIMSNLLKDLFFYAGYSSNRMGIPTHNNRINFDYLECDASIEKTSSMPEECLNELVGAFKNGVTYIHDSKRTQDRWDFKQEYENWENDLLED